MGKIKYINNNKIKSQWLKRETRPNLNDPWKLGE